MNLRSIVEEVVNDFNRRFATNLRILKADENEIVIHFRGHICFTCGTYDYFEDLAYELTEKLGREYVVESYEQLDDGTYIVHYKPKELVKERKREIHVYFIEYHQPNKN